MRSQELPAVEVGQRLTRPAYAGNSNRSVAGSKGARASGDPARGIYIILKCSYQEVQPQLRLRIPIAFAAVILLASSIFYFMKALEARGAAAFGLANALGLLVVFFGVVAAAVILRRASPT